VSVRTPAVPGARSRPGGRPEVENVSEAELLVGTKKGLFVLRGPRGGAMEVAGRLAVAVSAAGVWISAARHLPPITSVRTG